MAREPETRLDASVEALERGAAIGRYTVLEKLGVGGMGVVYSAYDATLDRKVALKVLLQRGREFESRLEREAQAMARLSHPNVVSVFDTGSVNRRVFMAMEFIHGPTLRAWRREKDRTWQEVLRVYVEAGRGLGAAHAAGLVHRDFKPDNALVSKGGAVKVTDFGIARALGEATEKNPGDGSADHAEPARAVRFEIPESVRNARMPPFPHSASALETPLTEEGSLLGTPGYMAPEQYAFAPVDARTDQFAYAASLYEALYGQKPFSGKGIVEIGGATMEGRINEPPKGTDVPARILRVIHRALSVERGQRYPSMQALLDDLMRDPARRWRRAAAFGGAAVAMAGVFFGAQRIALKHQGGLCSGATAEASEVWNPTVQGAIAKALLATGVPYAQETWDRTRKQIDADMTRWTAMHTETCEATRVHGHQSEQVMTARMACLEQHRDAVRALSRVLASADRTVVAKALPAAMDLPNLSSCNDVTTLTAGEPAPEDPAARAELAAIQSGLASVKAKFDAGQYKLARDEVEPLLIRARKLGHHTAIGRALLWSARTGTDSGASLDEVIDDGNAAVLESDAGRDDATRTEAAVLLIGSNVTAGRYADAGRWEKLAGSILERTGEDGAERAAWLGEAAGLFDAQGKYQEASERSREAIELAKRSGDTAAHLSKYQGELASELGRLGMSDEATRLSLEADDTIARELGEDHPLRINSLSTCGYVAGITGDNPGAAKYDEQAIRLAEKVAPDSRRLPALYNNYCSDLGHLGKEEEALAECEKGLASARLLYGEESAITGTVYVGTGTVLYYLHRYDDAIPLFQRAIEIESTGAKGDIPARMFALEGLGEAQVLGGKPREAVATLEKACALEGALQDRSAEGQTLVAIAHFALARALYALGTRTARVAELARAALATDRALGLQMDVQDIEAWLKEKRL